MSKECAEIIINEVWNEEALRWFLRVDLVDCEGCGVSQDFDRHVTSDEIADVFGSHGATLEEIAKTQADEDLRRLSALYKSAADILSSSGGDVGEVVEVF